MKNLKDEKIYSKVNNIYNMELYDSATFSTLKIKVFVCFMEFFSNDHSSSYSNYPPTPFLKINFIGKYLQSFKILILL